MSECIDHNKTGNVRGYGVLWYKGKMERSHRVSYCESKGIPLKAIRGLLVRHTCDNPRCINPDHLLIGTHQDNSTDMTTRSRQAKGEKQGLAKLTEEDVKFIRENYVRYSRKWGTYAIAEMLGVGQSTVHYVVSGANWKHI